MVDAARTEPALRDLKTAAFAEEEIAGGYAHVLEQDFGVAMRRVVVAEHRQHAQHLDAGRIERNEDLRLLLVASAARIGLSHDDGDLAARIADARRPPLAAVDDIIVAVAAD